jgi:MFS family permease
MPEESQSTNWGQYRLVIGLSFLQSLIWGLVLSMFPLFARELGAKEFAIGSLAAVHPLLSVLGAIPMGLLANRVSRKGMFALAYGLSFLAALAYSSTGSAAGLVVPQVLFGLSVVAYWPTQHAHISDNVDPAQRARLYGLSMGLTGFGGIIGPVLAGRIADTLGFQVLYWFYASVTLIGLGLCTRVKEPVEDTTILATQARGVSMMGTRALLARPALQFVFLATVAMFVQWGLRDTFLPLYAADLNLSRTAIGALATCQTISMSATRLLLGTLGHRAPAGRAVLAFVALSALVTLAVPALHGFGALAVVALVAGIGSGACVPLNLTNVANATSRQERPMAMSLESAASAAGRLFSSFTFGWLAGHIGVPMLFIVGNAGVLLAVFGLTRMRTPGLEGGWRIGALGAKPAAGAGAIGQDATGRS